MYGDRNQNLQAERGIKVKIDGKARGGGKDRQSKRYIKERCHFGIPLRKGVGKGECGLFQY